MRFLVDASMPRSSTKLLRLLGHDATDVRDIGLGAATDAAIADHAQRNHMALVTRDFDFADVRNYPPAEYPGIVVLKLADDSTTPDVANSLQKFVLREEWLTMLNGRLAIVEAWRVRFRPG